MKANLLLPILLIAAVLQSNAQDVLPQVKPRIKDSFETNNQLLMQNSINKNVLATQNLPYPIIFIHGLDSSSDTWIDMGTNLVNKGLSFGGRIDFCLNDDGNKYTSNKNVWTSTNNNIPAADIALYTDFNTDLTVADFYFLNFNIDNNK
jgi:pimeloyl-ACP methyl ester carboxylesterase